MPGTVAFAIDERWIEEPLRADNIEALAQALLSQDRPHARTRVDYEQVATLTPLPDGRCRLEGAGITLRLEVRVPRWAGEAPDDPLARRFGPVADGLRIHEAGHVAIAREEARRRHEALAGAGSFPDCRAARRFLLRQQLSFNHSVRRRNEVYDQRTALGARQGATLELRRRRRESGRPLW